MVEMEGLNLSYNHKWWNRELTLKCKLKCYLNPWITHWALALIKGNREPHEAKKKYFDLGGNWTHDLVFPVLRGTTFIHMYPYFLSYNQLTVLSPAIKQLKKLKMLFVSGNPFIVEGIRSVMELEDTCKIDTFFSDIQGE